MNYMAMDILTKGALWDYKKLGSDEIEPTNEKTLNLEETNQDDEQEISEIFRIETNLFDYETPLCEKFKEFNYLLKIDPDVLTNDIVGFKTYDEYKDDWIYEWNKNVPWVHEKPWTNTGVWTEPTPIVHCYDFEYYNGDRNDWEYGRMEHEDDDNICSYVVMKYYELPGLHCMRFEMIKYSFGQDEEYVAIKEDEYDDLMSTSKDACQAYQEISHDGTKDG
ncbi:hypothetical protein Tco_0724931 [Tanacetum coccineum]|uniref:YubB ferredoxin-like domain-containing protein n=1 Tax=Tanacetum coccineum TaxID=301880 RepID=A0ABQ4YCA0_9ASTR